MGDSRRATVFAEWIEKQFPLKKFKKVVEYAGGTGRVSLWLKRIGYDATVIDLRKPKVPKGVGKIVSDVTKVKHRKGEYDFVIAMHPDGATLPAIKAAKDIGCPFAVVPCCAIIPPGFNAPKYSGDWDTYVERYAICQGFETWMSQLYIRGKNIVIKGFSR